LFGALEGVVVLLSNLLIPNARSSLAFAPQLPAFAVRRAIADSGMVSRPGRNRSKGEEA